MKLEVIADNEIKYMADMVTGAHVDGFHYTGVNAGRDFNPGTFADIRNAVAGDACPRCFKPVGITRGIEVGHIFKLGTKYSAKMHAEFLDEHGESKPFVMGCYGMNDERFEGKRQSFSSRYLCLALVHMQEH